MWFGEVMKAPRVTTSLQLDPAASTCGPASIPSTSFSGADFVLFAHMEPLSAADLAKGTFANTQHCQQDQHGRPTAAYMHVGVKQIGDLYWSDRINGTQTALMVLIHELSHALAFSQNLYPHFRDSAGAKVLVHRECIECRDSAGAKVLA
jgi:hypothetical protein